MNARINLRGAKILAGAFVEGEEMTVRGIVLGTLPKAKAVKTTPPKPKPVPFDFDCALAFSWQADGSCEAAYGPASKLRPFKRKIQLIKLAHPVSFLVWQGKAYADGSFKPIGHWPGGLFGTEAEAREFYNQALAALKAEIETARPNTAPPAVNPAIARLREMARLFPANRQRYMAQIAALEAEAHAVKERDKSEAKQPANVTAHRQAIAQLARELFPDAHAVKPGPDFQREFAKAMNRDCARLGIDAAFATGELAPAEILALADAIKGKSPHKPAQAEAVLNWLAKKYCDLPEAQWTASVANQVPGTKKAGLARTVRGKFKLKSTVKGRPETR